MSAHISHDIRHSRGRNFASAPNTIKADKAPLKWLEAYRHLHEKCTFENMTFIEIEGDNLEYEILGMMTFASSTPIPRYYVRDFEPPPQTNVDKPIGIVSTTTLSKYIGKIIKIFHYTWPEHEDFKDLDINKPEEVPAFWTRLRPQFETRCDRYHNSIGSDYSLADTTKRPLYLSNPVHLTVNAEDQCIRDYVSKIDLQYILKNLIKKANTIGHQTDGKLMHRLILALSHHCCGRGGEVKFVDTSDWVYHAPFGCVDIVWTELKTVSKQAMPMFPNKKCWLSDFFHCVGSFWAVEDGLFRTPDQVGIKTFLLVPLHNVQNNTVTSKVTRMIRTSLPPGTPEHLEKQYSAKSTRGGAVTQLLTNPALNALGDITGRTGHQTNSSLDWYNDTRNVTRGMRGGKALAEWDIVTGGVQVPRFTCLAAGTSSAVHALIEKLFVTSLAAFKPGGSMYCVLEICAASLVMYHTTVTREVGTGNVISTKLRDSARSAMISDPAYPFLSPESILDKWSETILVDFRSRNPEIAEATPDIRSLTVSLNQQSSQMNEMSARIQEVTSICRQRDAACETQRHQMDWYAQQLNAAHRDIAQLRGENTQLRGENVQLRCQLSHARSNYATMHSALQSPGRQPPMPMPMQQQQLPPPPPPPPMQQEQQPPILPPMQPEALRPPPPPPPLQQQEQRQHMVLPPPPPPPPPPLPLQPTLQQQRQVPPRQLIHTAQAASVEKPTNKNVSLSAMLVKLYEANSLSSLNDWKDIANSSIPNEFSRKSNVKYSLELCQYVMTDYEINLFKQPNSFTDRVHLLDLAAGIEQRSFRKMYELEGEGDPDLAIQLNSMAGLSKQKKPVVGGIGPRVLAYKHTLPDGGPKVALQEPSAGERVGTPPGNTSMMAYMRRLG